MSLQLSSVKSQLEEQRVRLEKTHSDEMEKLLQNVAHNILSICIHLHSILHLTSFTFAAVTCLPVFTCDHLYC